MNSDRVTRAIKPNDAPKTEEGAASAAPRFLESQEAITHDLQFPIEWQGIEYRTVEFRRLKGVDFTTFAEMQAKKIPESVGLLSLVTGLPTKVVEFMDGDDFLDLTEKMKDFLPARFQPAKQRASTTGRNTPA